MHRKGIFMLKKDTFCRFQMLGGHVLQMSPGSGTAERNYEGGA